ncbi:heterokaryon incompatibility protein domain-containing protein [Trichoderma chlorosporum]
MAPAALNSTAAASPGGTTAASSGSLSAEDIAGIAVGVPSALLALASLVIALLAWRFPKSPVGRVVRERVLQQGSNFGSNVLFYGRQYVKSIGIGMFKHFTEGDADVEVTVSAHKNSDCTPAGEKRLTIIVREDNHQIFEKDFYMFTSQDDNAAKFIKARNRITDVSTPSSHKLALDCLNHCVSNHHQGCCPPPQPDTVLPDRVIDCSSVSNPKLIETGGKQHGFYVTLSYVWGGPQPMTTSDNLEEYTTKGLLMSKFPQTIQDAVQVTHNLGQRYLWIDALCIIQDSEQDKARQLGKMHSIYRNSYFTINVACAKSTHEGFLHKARPQRVTTTRIPLPCLDGTMGSIWLAKPMDTDINDASHSYWDEIEPITYRAWRFQEKALPPRSLVFASDTLKY